MLQCYNSEFTSRYSLIRLLAAKFIDPFNFSYIVYFDIGYDARCGQNQHIAHNYYIYYCIGDIYCTELCHEKNRNIFKACNSLHKINVIC